MGAEYPCKKTASQQVVYPQTEPVKSGYYNAALYHRAQPADEAVAGFRFTFHDDGTLLISSAEITD